MKDAESHVWRANFGRSSGWPAGATHTAYIISVLRVPLAGAITLVHLGPRALFF